MSTLKRTWREILAEDGAGFSKETLDLIELDALRWLEATSGYPRHVDQLLNAVVRSLESRRAK